jgi:protein SCO1/2
MSNATIKAKSGAKKNGTRTDKDKGLPNWALASIGAGFAVLFGAFVYATSGPPTQPALAQIGGPFQLIGENGETVTDKTLLGHPFLVFFGYTHCPDICHTTLFELSETLRALGPDAGIAALFVTVDPERDTPAVLKDYLSSFDQRIVGLSGTREALDDMLKRYKIYSKRADGPGQDYSVDHTSVVYLMDKNGRFVNAFNVSRRPAEAAKELERYL